MASRLTQRLARVEALLGAGKNHLVPYSDAWFAYWAAKVLRVIECARRREPTDETVPVQIIHALIDRASEEQARQAMREADAACLPVAGQ